MNIKTMENYYFLDKENIPKMIKMLKDWLNLDPIVILDRPDGGGKIAVFLIDGIKINFMSKADEATNTAMKVNGATSALTLVVETKKDVEDLYKKAVDLGFATVREPFEIETNNSYLTSIQDEFKNYWYIVTYL